MTSWDIECIRRYQVAITECNMEISEHQRKINELQATADKYEQLIKEIQESC